MSLFFICWVAATARQFRRNGKEDIMAKKVTCRPVRTGKKPGRKTVPVKPHARSKPKPIGDKCQ